MGKFSIVRKITGPVFIRASSSKKAKKRLKRLNKILKENGVSII